MIIGKKKHFSTPILLLTWRREESLKFIINKLREINAKKIYVSSDGFRNGANKNKDIDEIISTRELLLKEIDWPCNVKFNFNYSNLGCKVAVSSAIDWFFDKEISGIILEEDCIPNNSHPYNR